MKSGIVTVYNSMNCGSFLQAYALSNALEQNGHEAVLIHHAFADHSASRNRYVKDLLRQALRGRFSAAKRLVQRRKAFQQAVSGLNVAKSPQDVSCYIFGSDTIWDVSIPYFRNHRDFFWGLSFENARLISYAPSMGYTKQADLEKLGFASKALSRLDAVSVRDHSDKALLEHCCDKPITVVCDPTVLLDRTGYDKIAKPTDLEDFLFIYYYGKMPEAYVREISAFAKERKLKTVTFGNSNPWCDISLAYDPLLFLSLYRKAAYIVTNTFHGTVFANIYEKKFVVTKNEKPKVVGFLSLCQMSDKMTETARDLPGILQSDYRYEITRELLAQERKQGLSYLMNALREQA